MSQLYVEPMSKACVYSVHCIVGGKEKDCLWGNCESLSFFQLSYNPQGFLFPTKPVLKDIQFPGKGFLSCVCEMSDSKFL